jgi:thiol-disulfide isomerase/thioredoxin
VDYVVVGRCTEPKEGNSTLWHIGFILFNYLLRVEIFYMTMIKKNLFLLLFIFLLTDCTKPEKKEPVVKKEINELPYLAFKNLDGSAATTRDLPPASILILFNTDCDHCQREAKSIYENLESFKEYTLLFIASDQSDTIEKFAKEYQLDNQPNIRFGKADGADVYMNFGSIPTPAIYVYSKERRFVKSFMGETPVEQIIMSL